MVLVVGLLKWLVGLQLFPPQLMAQSASGFGFEMGRVAGNVAAGYGFAFAAPDGQLVPTAWFSPVYPLFLAGILRTCGMFTTQAAQAVLASNAAFQGITAGLLYLLGVRLSGRAAGWIAAALFLVNPNGWQFLGWAWHTQLYALLLLVHLDGLLVKPRSILLPGVLAGGTLALAMLVDGAAVMLLPVVLFHLLHEYDRRQGRQAMTAALLSGLLLLTPWTIRNYSVFGVVNPLRGNVGINLWVGNHPGNREESYHGTERSPWQSPEENRLYVEMGERAYSRFCLERALGQIRLQPGRFLEDCLTRATGFWFGEWWIEFAHVSWVTSAGLIGLTLLAIAGAYRNRRRGIGLFVAILLLFPLPYYLTVHGHGRYRAPIEPLMCLLGALAFRRIQNPNRLANQWAVAANEARK